MNGSQETMSEQKSTLAANNDDVPNQRKIWHPQNWQMSSRFAKKFNITDETRFNINANVDFGTYHKVLDLKSGGLILFLVNGIFPN